MNTTHTTCSRKGCNAAGELALIGAARLCVVHFLRSRVQRNAGRA